MTSSWTMLFLLKTSTCPCELFFLSLDNLFWQFSLTRSGCYGIKKMSFQIEWPHMVNWDWHFLLTSWTAYYLNIVWDINLLIRWWHIFESFWLHTVMWWTDLIRIGFWRYDELASKETVEYIAGGNVETSLIFSLMMPSHIMLCLRSITWFRFLLFTAYFNWCDLLYCYFQVLHKIQSKFPRFVLHIRVSFVLAELLWSRTHQFWGSCSGCSKFLVLLVTSAALERISLERRWRKTQQLLVSM